jgi:hypothetical protein
MFIVQAIGLFLFNHFLLSKMKSKQVGVEGRGGGVERGGRGAGKFSLSWKD